MASAELQVGDVVADKYEIESLVGRGGMGTVYRAKHRITGRIVAVKWMIEDQPDRRKRFLREARAMGKLSHPNVVSVLDAGDHQGAIFLVMDYLEGKSLREMIGGPAPLGLEAAIELLMPALEGVAAAHQAGILHRDLKPENLFVCCDRDGTPYDTKVLDFGVAKAFTEHDVDEPALSLTHSGTIVGTPKYMAPEQIGDERRLDPRCDVYSLGVILFELLTGLLPYRARSLNALMLEILTGVSVTPKSLRPDLPEGLSEMIMRALARDPDERFRDVESFARALEPYAGDRRFEAPRSIHTPSGAEKRPQRITRPDKISVRPRGEQTSKADTIARPSDPAAVIVSRPPIPDSEPAPPLAPTVEAPKERRKRRTLGLPIVALVLLCALVVVMWIVDRASDDRPPTTAASPAREEVRDGPLAVENVPAEADAPQPTSIAPPVESPPPAVEATSAPTADPRVSATSRPRVRNGRSRVEPMPEAERPTVVAPTGPNPIRVESRAGTLQQDDF